MLAVVAVVVGALLVAVGGVVGGVEVQEDPLRRPPLGALPDVELAQGVSHPKASASIGGVLQPRHRRLAREVLAGLRQRPAHELEERVGAKGVGIVLVLVAARYLEDALLYEVWQ